MSKGKVEIVLNSGGVRALLRSSEMQSLIKGHAKSMAGKVGGEVKTYVAGSRAVAIVNADDKDNALLKAVR